jgi:hypothetical protein
MSSSDGGVERARVDGSVNLASILTGGEVGPGGAAGRQRSA